jgi:hypothetical protein
MAIEPDSAMLLLLLLLLIYIYLKVGFCILLRVLGQVQGFRLTQHCFE